jgi:valine dehydrogenase (NAD+)
VVTDVNEQAVEALRGTYPQVDVAPDAEALVKGDLDVYAPCALGGALDASTVESLSASIVCGAANNQLADEGEHGTATRLMERGITYAPDFLVNAGGVIQVSDELHGFDMQRARERTATIFEHTLEVLRDADAAGVSPALAADRLAERRIAAGGRRPWLPGDAVGAAPTAGEHRNL